MMKELERVGIPTVLICTILPLAASLGVNRVVAAKAIPHPLGDPTLSGDEERQFRTGIVRKALESLTSDVESQVAL